MSFYAASKASEIFNEMQDFIERIDGNILYEHQSDFVGANHKEFCVTLMDLVMKEKTKALESKLKVAASAAVAYRELATYYRIGKQPSERLFKDLAKAALVMDELEKIKAK